jgi:hypothetical protein
MNADMSMGLRGRRTYVRVDGVVDAMAGKVIGFTTVSLVSLGLACVKAGREPAAEFGVVSGSVVSVAVVSSQTDAGVLV